MSSGRPRPVFQELLQGFECGACGEKVALAALVPVCPRCGRPLLARYDLASLARAGGPPGPEVASDLWRWHAVLPFVPDENVVRLGEGGTPLLPAPRLADRLGIERLWIKEEAPNPTQSFKARGLALAVNGALALGHDAIALPSAGNAGCAAAAYAAAAGIRCRIAVPEDTPLAFVTQPRACGAEVLLVPGTIADAGRAIATWAPAPEWWNVATFREPFRLEGKKTLGYEIAAALERRLPDAIVYPTGGGTGIVGMWRAFLEMRELGWTRDPLPRLISVQAEGCAPVVRAFEQGAAHVTPWADASTLAAGLRVPSPFADTLILESIRATGGRALAVSEDELLDGMAEMAEFEGCFACPEGGATLAAIRRLLATGTVRPDDRVVFFNTGSGLQYAEAWSAALARRAADPTRAEASRRSR